MGKAEPCFNCGGTGDWECIRDLDNGEWEVEVIKDGCVVCDGTGYDTNRTDEITCPYCGHEFSDSWEIQSDGPQQCYECGKTFDLEIITEVTYTTRRVEV